MIRVGWRESKYRQLSSQDWVVFGSGYDKVQAMGSQIRNFSKACRGEEPLLVSGEDAIASVEVVEAIYRSLGENCWTGVYDGSPERRAQPREASVAR
jgi:predicted dehydrogenase